MIKTKWILIILGIIDLILVIMYFTDHYFIFLIPTGYVVPLLINLIIIFGIGFRSKSPKSWPIIGLLLSIPIVLPYAFMVWLLESNYTEIDSPHNEQSLIIEYRHAMLYWER